MKVLFVCQANVGRSQMAEAFYNFHTRSNHATSAGVEDFREKYHYKPTREIIEAMLEKGIDISHQRIDFLTPRMLIKTDKVVVLCSKDLCPKFLLDNKKVIFREIEDPHQQDEKTIQRIRDQIEALVVELIKNV
jgi:protein-tyrosine-phosphatase